MILLNGILWLAALIPLSTAVDCLGKPFRCRDRGHFIICVDLGNGVSSSIDSFVIPCPNGTECRDTNHYECEVPPPTTQASLLSDNTNATVAISSSPTNEALPTTTESWNNENAITDNLILDTTIVFTTEPTFTTSARNEVNTPNSNVLQEVVPAAANTSDYMGFETVEVTSALVPTSVASTVRPLEVSYNNQVDVISPLPVGTNSAHDHKNGLLLSTEVTTESVSNIFLTPDEYFDVTTSSDNVLNGLLNLNESSQSTGNVIGNNGLDPELTTLLPELQTTVNYTPKAPAPDVILSNRSEQQILDVVDKVVSVNEFNNVGTVAQTDTFSSTGQTTENYFTTTASLPFIEQDQNNLSNETKILIAGGLFSSNVTQPPVNNILNLTLETITESYTPLDNALTPDYIDPKIYIILLNTTTVSDVNTESYDPSTVKNLSAINNPQVDIILDVVPASANQTKNESNDKPTHSIELISSSNTDNETTIKAIITLLKTETESSSTPQIEITVETPEVIKQFPGLKSDNIDEINMKNITSDIIAGNKEINTHAIAETPPKTEQTQDTNLSINITIISESKITTDNIANANMQIENKGEAKGEVTEINTNVGQVTDIGIQNKSNEVLQASVLQTVNVKSQVRNESTNINENKNISITIGSKNENANSSKLENISVAASLEGSFQANNYTEIVGTHDVDRLPTIQTVNSSENNVQGSMDLNTSMNTTSKEKIQVQEIIIDINTLVKQIGHIQNTTSAASSYNQNVLRNTSLEVTAKPYSPDIDKQNHKVDGVVQNQKNQEPAVSKEKTHQQPAIAELENEQQFLMTNTTQERLPMKVQNTQQNASTIALSAPVESVSNQEQALINSFTTQPSNLARPPQQQPSSLASTQHQQPTNLINNKPQQPTNVAITQQQPRLDVANTQQQPISNMASPQQQTSSDVASTQQQTSSYVASTQQRPPLDVESTQQQPSLDVASTQQQPSLDVANTHQQPLLDVATKQQQKSSDVATQPLLQPTPTVASMQQQQTLNVVSTQSQGQSVLSSMQKKPPLNIASTQQQTSTDVESTQQQPSLDVASTQQQPTSNVAITQQQTSSDVAMQPLQQPTLTVASMQQQQTLNVVSTQSLEQSILSSMQKQPPSNIASTQQQTSTDVASTYQQPSLDVASKQQQTSSDVGSTMEQPTSNVASMQQQQTTNVASIHQHQPKNLASPQLQQPTNLSSTQQHQTTNVVSTQKQEQSILPSTQKQPASKVASTQQQTSSTVASTQKQQTTNVISTQLSHPSNIARPQQQEPSSLAKTQHQQPTNLVNNKPQQPTNVGSVHQKLPMNVASTEQQPPSNSDKYLPIKIVNSQQEQPPKVGHTLQHPLTTEQWTQPPFSVNTQQQQPIQHEPTISHVDRIPSITIQTPLIDHRSSGAESAIDCKILNRGRYSDKTDCRKFYICIGTHGPIQGLCPQNTVFSEIKKQCTRNLSHCIRENKFQCTTTGRFCDHFSDNVYYICAQNSMGHFVRFKLQCSVDYYLDKKAVKCKPKASIENQSVSSDDESTRNKIKLAPDLTVNKQQSWESDGEFECTKEGRFPISGECRKYYRCQKKHSKLRKSKRNCDSDEVFHKDKKKCVDAESYECVYDK